MHATYLPEAEALVQAGQLPLHAAILPAHCQPALSREEPAVPLPHTQFLHHHVTDVPGRRGSMAVVPEADLLEWAQPGWSTGGTTTHQAGSASPNSHRWG